MNAVVQYLRYNKIDPEIRKGLHVNKQIPSVRDHDLTIEECRRMYKVAPIEGKVLVKTWLLGIRAKDASHLQWRDFEFRKTSKELKLIRIITKKEDIEAQLFIDQEFQDLLTEYISSVVDKENPYLLQSNKGGRISEKQLSRKIKALRDKAGIRVKEGKVFGWHLARYLRSKIGTEYDLSTTALKMMIGHSTGVFGRYAKRSKVKKAAEKLSRLMRMEPERTEENVNLEEKVNALKEALNTLLDQITILGSATQQFTGNPSQQIPENYWEMSAWEKIEWYTKTYGEKKVEKEN